MRVLVVHMPLTKFNHDHADFHVSRNQRYFKWNLLQFEGVKISIKKSYGSIA